MNKKQMTMLAIGVLAVVAIYWFFFRKKDTKKESSFNPDYLVIGDEMGYNGESGYKKDCPKGKEIGQCTMVIDPNSNGGVTIYKYKCCVEAAAASGRFVYQHKKRPAGSTSTRQKNCFDPKGNPTPCPPTIPEEDIIRTTTFPG